MTEAIGRTSDSPLIRKLRSCTALSAEEISFLRGLERRSQRVEADTDLIVEGDIYKESYVLREGWALRYKLLPDGRRQILNLILPGDFIGLRASLFQTADHSVATLTDVMLCPFPSRRIIDLCREFPRLALGLNWSAAREEAILAEHIVSIGRRSAYERVAHLILELLRRLQFVGLAGERSYEMPLTQEILADVLGLSIVHVNRTLRRLRRDGLIRLDTRRIVIRDEQGLRDVAGFEPHYLDQNEDEAAPAGRERGLAARS